MAMERISPVKCIQTYFTAYTWQIWANTRARQYARPASKAGADGSSSRHSSSSHGRRRGRCGRLSAIMGLELGLGLVGSEDRRRFSRWLGGFLQGLDSARALGPSRAPSSR